MTNIQPLAPTDKQLEDFAVEEQFLRFCDADEFTQIARAVLAKWGTPPAVAGEPIGYCHEIKWRAHQSEQVQKITRKAHPEYGYTQALYTTPQPTHAQPVAREPLSDEEVDSLCKVGFVYVIDGKVTRTPTQYRDELKAAQRYGLRKGEHAHGIKGGQHGTE